MHFSLTDCVLDMYQNAVESGAYVIKLDFVLSEKDLSVSILDNGKGMTESQLECAKDPFYTDGQKHSHRKVGLGIPFLIQAVDDTNGEWKIVSEEGKGTFVSFRFDLSHIDTPPVGNIMELFLTALSFGGPEYELILHRVQKTNSEVHEYTLSRSELIEAVGDFSDATSLVLLRQFLLSQEEDLVYESQQ